MPKGAKKRSGEIKTTERISYDSIYLRHYETKTITLKGIEYVLDSDDIKDLIFTFGRDYDSIIKLNPISGIGAIEKARRLRPYY